MNWPTLLKIAEINPSVPIYVANLSNSVFPKRELFSGVLTNSILTNIDIVEVNTWVNLDENTRFMILPDSAFPAIDTAMLFEYKGHRILNTVDCKMPNNNVDLLLTEFAGGASGFPHMFEGDRYTEDFYSEFMSRERKKLLLRITQLAQGCSARYHVPFAGYFVEARQQDARCKRLNKKNSAEDASEYVSRRSKGTKSIALQSGQSLDLSSGKTSDSWDGKLRKSWNFRLYDMQVSKKLQGHEYLGTREAFEFYFNWVNLAGYDLVLQIYECESQLKPLSGTPRLVDFLDLSFPSLTSSRTGARTLTIKIRRDKLWLTMLTGINWDKLYIGF